MLYAHVVYARTFYLLRHVMPLYLRDIAAMIFFFFTPCFLHITLDADEFFDDDTILMIAHYAIAAAA